MASSMTERFARAAEKGASLSDSALLVVVGPTASGKSDLAMHLCEGLRGEIVSADSVQIYRGFDIGSGKPTAEERARVPHHLVDVLDPLDAIDASRFAELADQKIAELRARGVRPIVCGGTFLWTKALLFGLADAAPSDTEVRARLRAEAAEHGAEALHARLARLDPQLATRLHPHDVVRVSRGLEVLEITGRPLSAWQAEHGFSSPKYDAHLFTVERTPEELGERIERRVRGWLAEGWIDETRQLFARGYGEARAMGSVGYKQVAEHLAGRLDERDLATAIVRATRLFARRQRTWIRSIGRGPRDPSLTLI